MTTMTGCLAFFCDSCENTFLGEPAVETTDTDGTPDLGFCQACVRSWVL